MLSLSQRLAEVPDTRLRKGRRHPLSAVLNLLAVGVICGLRSLSAIAQFGRSLPAESAAELGFVREESRRRGRMQTPCKASLSYMLRRIDLDAFESQLSVWASERSGVPVHLALDGKTLRGTRDGECRPVHLLALYAVEAKAVVAQTPVGDKTNEHKAAIAMLKGRDLQGATVTSDAMFTHRDYCQAVIDGGGHYLLPVGDNQPNLKQDVQAAFAPPPEGLSPPTAAVV